MPINLSVKVPYLKTLRVSIQMDYKKVSLYGGLTIVVGTHIGMVFDLIPMNTMMEKNLHAYANLVASGLILYGVV
jgi:hypothetical protein